MRIGVLATLLALPVPASAEPAGNGFEVSGFLGVDYFGNDIGLGGARAPEQRPQTAPTFGGRLTFVPLRLGRRFLHVDLGAEAEVSFTPSWTGYGFDGPRPSYFAPVFGYRGNLLIRVGLGQRFLPHVTAGGGGETVISDSPYMAKESDPIFQWGVGSTFQLGDKWHLRFDARQGVMEAIDGSTTLTYEAHMSIGARLGVTDRPLPIKHVDIVTRPLPEPTGPRDADHDGLNDDVDACPNLPEVVNGIDDQDGCPEHDTDGDGLVDGADKCPARAEDKDGFQDEDGCAEDDNDNDGVLDDTDKCPLQPETKNGILDDDGCPDDLPANVRAALDEVRKVTFDPGDRRLKAASKAALDKAIAVLLERSKLKVTLTVHPEGASDTASDLATKRMNVIKFYMTEQGVASGNLTTVIGAPVTKKQPLVELTVTPP